jgi:hypothetical protein
MNTLAVTLLIGNDLGVPTLFLVQGGVCSPQDGEVDPDVWNCEARMKRRAVVAHFHPR